MRPLNRAHLPSIGALAAFESAARHGSFTAPPTNSTDAGRGEPADRQLEAQLGIALFERVRQRVFLTDVGRLYLGDVTALLKDLTDATQRAMAFAGGQGTLNIAVLPTLATRWLMPRLPGFLAEHPTRS